MGDILITGATGLLGSILSPHLRKHGYNIVTLARAGTADILVDLSDKNKAFEMLEHIQPTRIINLASLTNVDLCQDNPNMAYLANTRTVENIAYWIQETGTNCHLIQISTDQVYDQAVLHAEDDISLTNIYAFSKYSGELAAAQVQSSILRTNFIGRSKISHRESFSDWVFNSLTIGKNIQVLDDVFFSPLSMTTLVEMIQLVVERRPVGIFNLGSHNGMSKADFAFCFAERVKLPTENMTRIEARKAVFLKTYRPKDMRMDSSRFEHAIGVKLPALRDEILRVGMEYDEIA